MLRAKVDRNHGHMRDGLRELGATVSDTSRLGKGFPDLVVGWHGISLPVEVKCPDNPGLTDDEKAWWKKWEGSGIVAFYIDDVLKWFQGQVDDRGAQEIEELRANVLADEVVKYSKNGWL
jgi:hypothetical protein